MPDDEAGPQAPKFEPPSELERLIAQAETSPNTQLPDAKTCITPVAEDNLQQMMSACDHRMFMPSERDHCAGCGILMCPNCWSGIDHEFCQNCATEESTRLIIEPLRGSDGVEHAGRLIRPDPEARYFQPSFRTSAKRISEMSALELDAHIEEYTKDVKEAEHNLLVRQIRLGTAKQEKEERKSAALRSANAQSQNYNILQRPRAQRATPDNSIKAPYRGSRHPASDKILPNGINKKTILDYMLQMSKNGDKNK